MKSDVVYVTWHHHNRHILCMMPVLVFLDAFASLDMSGCQSVSQNHLAKHGHDIALLYVITSSSLVF